MTKVISLKCKYCGKKIESLYESQARYNLEAHEIMCRKEVRKDGNNGKIDV